LSNIIFDPQPLTGLGVAKKRFLDKLEMTGWVGDDEIETN
jgi:hypothetical protein